MRPKYRIVGNSPFGITENGAMLYDLLETKTEAQDICAVLNSGIGPEWDALEEELRRRGKV